ncbi:MAG TPA: response regulator [Elusimicrobiales bacterium]|nr:response regulator [Elusimicrobiales bacterium]
MTDNAVFSSSADKTVLIVDDDQDIRDLLESLVRKEGFKAQTAADGADAQAKVLACAPDIILLDLNLPKAGGFEVLQALQADGNADIPVIILTGRQLDRSTSELIRQQANVREFLEKPARTELIASRLHQILKTRPPQRL